MQVFINYKWQTAQGAQTNDISNEEKALFQEKSVNYDVFFVSPKQQQQQIKEATKIIPLAAPGPKRYHSFIIFGALYLYKRISKWFCSGQKFHFHLHHPLRKQLVNTLVCCSFILSFSLSLSVHSISSFFSLNQQQNSQAFVPRKITRQKRASPRNSAANIIHYPTDT